MSHLGSHRYQAAEDRFEPTSVSESETHAQHRDFNLLPHTVSARGVGGDPRLRHMGKERQPTALLKVHTCQLGETHGLGAALSWGDPSSGICCALLSWCRLLRNALRLPPRPSRPRSVSGKHDRFQAPAAQPAAHGGHEDGCALPGRLAGHVSCPRHWPCL